jgi:hypothetical protein
MFHYVCLWRLLPVKLGNNSTDMNHLKAHQAKTQSQVAFQGKKEAEDLKFGKKPEPNLLKGLKFQGEAEMPKAAGLAGHQLNLKG